MLLGPSCWDEFPDGRQSSRQKLSRLPTLGNKGHNDVLGHSERLYCDKSQDSEQSHRHSVLRAVGATSEAARYLILTRDRGTKGEWFWTYWTRSTNEDIVACSSTGLLLPVNLLDSASIMMGGYIKPVSHQHAFLYWLLELEWTTQRSNSQWSSQFHR